MGEDRVLSSLAPDHVTGRCVYLPSMQLFSIGQHEGFCAMPSTKICASASSTPASASWILVWRGEHVWGLVAEVAEEPNIPRWLQI